MNEQDAWRTLGLEPGLEDMHAEAIDVVDEPRTHALGQHSGCQRADVVGLCRRHLVDPIGPRMGLSSGTLIP